MCLAPHAQPHAQTRTMFVVGWLHVFAGDTGARGHDDGDPRSLESEFSYLPESAEVE